MNLIKNMEKTVDSMELNIEKLNDKELKGLSNVYTILLNQLNPERLEVESKKELIKQIIKLELILNKLECEIFNFHINNNNIQALNSTTVTLDKLNYILNTLKDYNEVKSLSSSNKRILYFGFTASDVKFIKEEKASDTLSNSYKLVFVDEVVYPTLELPEYEIFDAKLVINASYQKEISKEYRSKFEEVEIINFDSLKVNYYANELINSIKNRK